MRIVAAKAQFSYASTRWRQDNFFIAFYVFK